jgi:hypothetical protein
VLVEFAEDIHAGIGLWQALENYQSEFFGTPLPLFLEVGEPLAGRFDPRRVLSQGAMAVGGIVWGAAAEGFGTRPTLLAVGGLFVASLALARRWSLDPLDLPTPPAPRWIPSDAESVRVD